MTHPAVPTPPEVGAYGPPTVRHANDLPFPCSEIIFDPEPAAAPATGWPDFLVAAAQGVTFLVALAAVALIVIAVVVRFDRWHARYTAGTNAIRSGNKPAAVSALPLTADEHAVMAAELRRGGGAP